MANPHDEAGDGYHPNNLKLQPYPHDKVIELAKVAKEMGIQFHIAGIPFGAGYDRDLWRAFEAPISGNGYISESAGHVSDSTT